jgi:hypothetical protein
MATEQGFSGWTDLLHSSTKLLEQSGPSAQFPPLQVPHYSLLEVFLFGSQENVGKFKEGNVISSRVGFCLEVLLAEKNEGTRKLLLAENSWNTNVKVLVLFFVVDRRMLSEKMEENRRKEKTSVGISLFERNDGKVKM